MSQSPNPSPLAAGGRFSVVFEQAPIGMAMVAPDYRLIRVNAALCTVLGYSEQELLSKTIVDITHPDDIERDRQQAERLFQGKIPTYSMEKRFFTKDGRQVWLHLSAFLVSARGNDPAFGLAMVEDITDRKQGEYDLQMSEERYRSFIVNSSEAIWRVEISQPIPTDASIEEQAAMLYRYGYLAECNDATARLYGFERAEEAIGRPAGDFISPTNPINAASLQTFFANNYRLNEARTVDIDRLGKRKYMAGSVIGIVVNNHLMRIWGTQRDETERVLAEMQLEESRAQLRSLTTKLQRIGEMERADLARELHDVLGQALTGVKLDLSRIKKGLAASDEASLQRLNDASELIDKTVQQVRTMSTKLRPAVLDKFGLTAAIEWQCREFEERSGIRITCRQPLEEVDLPPEHSIALFRILQEALTNVARHAEATEITVVLHVDETEATLTISDNGRGIREEEIAAADSLGLLSMRERTEGLGGELTIEGKPGQTRINVRLPIKAGTTK
jgi:PAS domain S-box-containing protein